MDRHGHTDNCKRWVEVDMIRTNFRMEDTGVASIDKNFVLEDRCLNMADRYITMVKGDTLSFGVELEDQYGNKVDIDDATFVVRKTYNATARVVYISLGYGITRESAGTYTVRIAPEDTESAEAGLYFYQFRVEKNDDVYTIMRGILELEPEVDV